jgi:hypothetical protein
VEDPAEEYEPRGCWNPPPDDEPGLLERIQNKVSEVVQEVKDIAEKSGQPKIYLGLEEPEGGLYPPKPPVFDGGVQVVDGRVQVGSPPSSDDVNVDDLNAEDGQIDPTAHVFVPVDTAKAAGASSAANMKVNPSGVDVDALIAKAASNPNELVSVAPAGAAAPAPNASSAG